MKLSDSAGRLDGLFFSDVTKRGLSSRLHITMKVAVAFVIVLGVTAIGLLLLSILKWQRKPKGHEKQKTFSSWFLPLNASHCSFLSSKSRSTTFPSFMSSGRNLGRYFTLDELCDATKSFDDKAVIGIGGFGKVYLWRVGRWNEACYKVRQSIIKASMNSRHRHLVSLIGYCDEQSEMILAYEYMVYGPLRDHLYGSSLPHLPWKQRLEICIGAARGLHYLHMG